MKVKISLFIGGHVHRAFERFLEKCLFFRIPTFIEKKILSECARYLFLGLKCSLSPFKLKNLIFANGEQKVTYFLLTYFYLFSKTDVKTVILIYIFWEFLTPGDHEWPRDTFY